MSENTAELQIALLAQSSAKAAFEETAHSAQQLSRELQETGTKGHEAESGLEAAGTEAHRAGERAEESSGLFGRLKEQLGEIGRIAAGVVLGDAIFGIAGGLEHVFEGLFDATNEAAKNLAQLRAVLASTGGAAGVTEEDALGLAEALGKITPFSKDATLGVENMLLTFTGISRSIFPQATEATLNMAQALGESGKDAAIQLGKALQDPILGATALRRVGVALTSQQEEQIKTLVRTGHTLEAQKLILQELNTEFGNSARAAGETFAGKLQILRNQLEETRKAIGDQLTGALSGLLERLSPIITEMGEKAPAALAAFEGKVGELASAVAPPFKAIAGAIGEVVNALKALATGDANSFFLALEGGAQKLGLDIAGLRETFLHLTDFLFGTVPQAFAAVKPDIEAVASAVRQLLQDGVAVLQEGLQQLALTMSDVGDLLSFLGRTAQDLVGGPLTHLTDRMDVAKLGSEAWRHAIGLLLAAIDGVAGVIRWATRFFSDHTSALAAVAGIAATATTTFVGLKVATFAQQAATLGATVATGAMTVAQGLLNAVMEANPIFLVIAALVGLAAAFTVAYKRSEEFREFVNNALAAVGHTFSQLGSLVNDVVTAMLGKLNDFIGGVERVANAVARVVHLPEIRLPRLDISAITTSFGEITDMLGHASSAVKMSAGDLFGSIKDAIGTALSGMPELARLAGDDAGYSLDSGLGAHSATVEKTAKDLAEKAFGDGESGGGFQADPHLPHKAGSGAGHKLAQGLKSAQSQVESAVADLLSKFDALRFGTEQKLIDIGAKIGEQMNAAIVQASDQIKQAQENASNQTASILANTAQSRAERGARREFEQAQQDAALARKRQLDDEERLRGTPKDPELALRLKRAREDADRAYQRQQLLALQAFEDKQADEAQQRQIVRINADRDKRISAINEALRAKELAIEQSGEKDRQTLLAQYEKQFADLHDQFVKKLPKITNDAQAQLASFLADVHRQALATAGLIVQEMGNATTAISRLSGGPSISAVSAASASTGRNGTLVVNIPISGNTMLSDDSGVARQLALILKPELDRLVLLRA